MSLPITRPTLRSTLQRALESLPSVDAAWEGGSAAFGRDDGLSDLDVVAVVADDAVEAVFAAVEAALEQLSPIVLRHPLPPNGQFAQRFYRLRDAGEFLVVDFAVFRRSDPLLFREVELHGAGRSWFDRSGVLVERHLDLAADLELARARVAPLASGFAMFQHLVKKELARGHAGDAMAFFQTWSWRPLTEALRLLHDPKSRIFGPRYLARDLPADTAAAAAALAYAADPAALAMRHAETEAWFAVAIARLQALGPGCGLGEAALPPQPSVASRHS